MRAVLATLLLVVLCVAAPAAVASAQTTSEPAVAPSETVPPTEPAATDFEPPVEPGRSEVGDVAPSVSPVPADADDGIGWVLPVIAIVLLAAALGAARMLRRGPAGGHPGGPTDDPYDPEA